MKKTFEPSLSVRVPVDMAEEANDRMHDYRTSYAVVFREIIKKWVDAHPFEGRPKVSPPKRPADYVGPIVNPSFHLNAELASDGKTLTRAYGTSLQRVCIQGLREWLDSHPALSTRHTTASKGHDIIHSSEGPDGEYTWENRQIQLLREILRSGNRIAIQAISENLKAFRALSAGLTNEQTAQLASGDLSALHSLAGQSERDLDEIKALDKRIFDPSANAGDGPQAAPDTGNSGTNPVKRGKKVAG